jgi:ribose transport system ATP-binding protein
VDGNYRLQVEGVSKEFPGVKALDRVDFEAAPGEIHALVGENGAGKSTLTKILAGVLRPDEGRIVYEGREVRLSSPERAFELGVRVVYQDLNVFPHLSVAENLFLAHETTSRGRTLNKKAMQMDSQRVLDELELPVTPGQLVKDLAVGTRQMIAIGRTMLFPGSVIILDEPTASLSGKEVDTLFATLRRLKSAGNTIVYISHRLEEILSIADCVTVLRDGTRVGTTPKSEADVMSIVAMMAGREINEMYPKQSAEIGDEVLSVKSVTRAGAVHDASISVRAGEVVGLYGLVGAGRTELARIIFGLDRMDHGDIAVFGQSIRRHDPVSSVDTGVGFLTEDRKREGLCDVLSIRQNLTRAALSKLFRKGLISKSQEDAVAHKYVDDLTISTPSVERPVVFLSGGNQQKVVLGQWLCAGCRLLILDEPTKGIDVATKVEIYEEIGRLAGSGVGILLVSSDLPEVLGISDRLYIMCRGRIVKELLPEDTRAEEIVSYALGVGEEADDEN